LPAFARVVPASGLECLASSEAVAEPAAVSPAPDELVAAFVAVVEPAWLWTQLMKSRRSAMYVKKTFSAPKVVKSDYYSRNIRAQQVSRKSSRSWEGIGTPVCSLCVLFIPASIAHTNGSKIIPRICHPVIAFAFTS
jgi:hypothetical protein